MKSTLSKLRIRFYVVRCDISTNSNQPIYLAVFHLELFTCLPLLMMCRKSGRKRPISGLLQVNALFLCDVFYFPESVNRNSIRQLSRPAPKLLSQNLSLIAGWFLQQLFYLLKLAQSIKSSVDAFPRLPQLCHHKV